MKKRKALAKRDRLRQARLEARIRRGKGHWLDEHFELQTLGAGKTCPDCGQAV